MKQINKDNKQQIYIVLEIGYSAGIYINNYIHNIKIYDIDGFINDFKGTMFDTIYFKEYILKLKEYVKNDNKIEVLGIDIEHQQVISNKVLNFVTNLQDIQNIKKNIEYADSIKDCSDIDYEIKREEYLYSNFNEYLKGKECIVFLGAYHTSLTKKEDYYTVPLCSRLYKELNRILCLDIKYVNTKRRIKRKDNYEIIQVNDIIECNNEYINIDNIFINKSNISLGYIIIENGIEI